MGRRLKGPVQLNNSPTWFARLTVPPKDRAAAGKTRLIRSLETTDHAVALRRWGPMMSHLENELRLLLAGNSARQVIELNRGSVFLDDGEALPATEIASILGIENDSLAVESLITGKALPTTWEELLQHWARVKARSKARPLAPRTIKAAELAVGRIKMICPPHELKKESLRLFIRQLEATLAPTSVRQQFNLIQSIYRTALAEDLVDGSDPFALITYAATTPQAQQRRAFTDDELRLLNDELLLLAMTGLRCGELSHSGPTDVDAGFLVIQDKTGWRSKSISSQRRVPIPPGFTLKRYQNANGAEQKWRKQIRNLFDDRKLTVHSCRHTYMTLSRRAGCDPRIVEQLVGHAATTGSRSTAAYGAWPDAVLLNEAEKVWHLVHTIKG